MTLTDRSALDLPLAAVDPEVADAIGAEERRQDETLEMIASENFTPLAVLEAQGSVLTNKYAEGYPGRRYYGGCEHVDRVERLAIQRACTLFGAEHANVQPHSGASANMAALSAVLSPGDTILGMELAHGGHLTHGAPVNLSGKLYRAVPYHVRRENGLVDMDEVADLATRERPRVIIAGWSAYPRHLDFTAFREIADGCGALLLVDMAHFAGLVAAGLHPSPVPHADIVTTTTHKTLRGPRGGIVLCREELRKKIDSAVFPGLQGGPLEHVIAAKAVALGLAAGHEFAEVQRRTVDGAQELARRLLADDRLDVLTGGTDVHLVIADLQRTDLSGKDAEARLHDVGITANRNAVPYDPRPPAVASGLRLGTAALASRGFRHDDFVEVADIVALSLGAQPDVEGLRTRSEELARRIPLPWGRGPWR